MAKIFLAKKRVVAYRIGMTLEKHLPLDQYNSAAQIFMLGNLGTALSTSSNTATFSTTEQVIVLICNNSGATTYIAAVPAGDTTAITSSNGVGLPNGSCQTFGVPSNYQIRNGSGGAVMIMESFAGAGS